MAKVKFNKNYNVNRVVKKVVYTVLALYVGGTILTVLGDVMVCTVSPFYKGLKLIGWTVTSSQVINSTDGGLCNSTGNLGGFAVNSTQTNLITDTSGSGVLAVIGIIAIAGVVMEFITFG